MYNILTVYGTDVDGSHYRGDQWWQVDSPFQKQVMSYLDTDNHRIEWNSVPWDSANSEKEREKGAKILVKSVSRLIDEGSKKVVMIGHSHGGSVVYSAINRLVGDRKTKQQSNMVSAITIGTPFVRKNGKWSFFIVLMLFYILVLTLYFTFFDATEDGASEETPQQTEISEVSQVNVDWAPAWLESFLNKPWGVDIAFIVVAVMISVLVGVSTVILQARVINRHLQKVISRTTIVFSRIDEVINALTAVPGQKVSIATPSSIHAPTIFLLIVLSFVVHLILFSYYPVYNAWISDDAYTWVPYAAVITSGINKDLTLLVSVLITTGIASWIVSGWGLNWLMAKSFNLLVKSYGEQRAFGSDELAFKITSMEPRPRGPWKLNWGNPVPKELPVDWRPLPYEFDQQASVDVDEAAAAALRQARSALALSSVTKSHSLGESLFGALNWKELIHTAYFEVEDFAKFIAWLLIEREGLPPSRLYQSEVDKKKFQSWYNEISARLDR